MLVDVFTLHPAMFTGPLTESIVKRAQDMQAITITLHDIRDYTHDRHRSADDTPYGGGGGMVMKVEPVVEAVETIVPDHTPVVLMSPQGKRFNQQTAYHYAGLERIALVCGHYEGFDERIRETVITEEVSIGDYVLTGGELAAMVFIDAVVRLLPGVLGAEDGHRTDSHATGLLEHPHYTRPQEFRGKSVPDVLLSGHEANINRWRREQSLRRTWLRRPNLLLTAELSADDRRFLMTLAEEMVTKLLNKT